MTDLKKALILSGGAHLLLIVAGFFIYYQVTPQQILRQIEILDFRMQASPTNRVSEYRPVRRVGEPTVRDFNEGHSSNQAPQRVKLPQASTIIEEPTEQVEVPVHQEIATTALRLDERIGNTASRVESRIAQDASDLSASRIREQALALTGDEYLERLQSLLGEETDSSAAYYLEGEIKQRNIINEVVPEYPQGVQRNATVEIQFNVYPDGRVGDLIVVKRDEPVFEEISLESLSQWRFNPIPQDVVQRGKITFVYRLE